MMDAGRELDALVYEKVMGGTIRIAASADHQWIIESTPLKVVPPHYSTDIAAAWQVVDTMAERGFWCQMRNPFEGYGKGDYWAGFTPHSTTGWNGRPDHWTQAETMPLAICLAALSAVAGER